MVPRASVSLKPEKPATEHTIAKNMSPWSVCSRGLRPRLREASTPRGWESGGRRHGLAGGVEHLTVVFPQTVLKTENPVGPQGALLDGVPPHMLVDVAVLLPPVLRSLLAIHPQVPPSPPQQFPMTSDIPCPLDQGRPNSHQSFTTAAKPCL
eukprot:9503967-Pyramimonas_sp.AAC.1